MAEKWCAGPDSFDFAADYSDRIYTRFSDARARQCRTNDALAAARGRVDVAGAWELLADHGARADARADWGPSDHPVGGLIGATVCMHAGFGPVRGSQTTGSWVSQLPADGTPATHWVTGTAAPCLSVRVPVWFDAVEAAGLPDRGPAPGGTYSPGSLWWDHEDLHRTVLLDYPRLHRLIEPERRAVQARIDAAAAVAVAGVSTTGRSARALPSPRPSMHTAAGGRRPTRRSGEAWAQPVPPCVAWVRHGRWQAVAGSTHRDLRGFSWCGRSAMMEVSGGPQRTRRRARHPG